MRPKKKQLTILSKVKFKAMIWNIDERFPWNVLEILDTFSMFDLKKSEAATRGAR